MSESKKITLTSSDGERFEVDEAVAREFEIVAHMIEDGCVDGTIPIANVTSTHLAKVIEYCKKHVEAGAVKGNEEAKTGAVEGNEEAKTGAVQGNEEAKTGAVEGNEEAKTDLQKWDKDVFLKSLDEEMYFPLIVAANYLNVKGLLDLMCQKVADKIKDMQVEEVRTFFNIENDYTPEEQAEVRKENEWAFE